MTIFIFFAVLFLLVLVHEFGHFIVAKKTGMRVDEFGIGFPPKLFGVRKGETEYTLNLLPIGGVVKKLGGDSEGIEESERYRSFIGKSKLSQAAVLIAGVTMNVLFAWLLFTVALSLGTQSAVGEEDATSDAELVITEVLEGSPAEEAGLPVGARIEALRSGDDTLENLTPTAFRLFTTEHRNDELELMYHVHGESMTVSVTPETGVVEGEPERGAVGIALTMIEMVSRPVHLAFYEAGKMTLTTLRDITVGISGLLWDSLRLKADFSNVAGPVGIVGLVGEASAFGLTALLMFTAFISLNLAVINLLPFPALDGGRLVIVAVEAIKGSPIKPSWVATVNTIGFALLILLMVAVTWNDISRII